MFKCHKKIKRVKLKFIQWRKKKKLNSREEIEVIQKEMEKMHMEGGSRDCGKWNQLKCCLVEAYKKEKEYWFRKARVKWLSEGDKNSRFFQANHSRKEKMKQN